MAGQTPRANPVEEMIRFEGQSRPWRALFPLLPIYHRHAMFNGLAHIFKTVASWRQ